MPGDGAGGAWRDRPRTDPVLTVVLLARRSSPWGDVAGRRRCVRRRDRPTRWCWQCPRGNSWAWGPPRLEGVGYYRAAASSVWQASLSMALLQRGRALRLGMFAELLLQQPENPRSTSTSESPFDKRNTVRRRSDLPQRSRIKQTCRGAPTAWASSWRHEKYGGGGRLLHAIDLKPGAGLQQSRQCWLSRKHAEAELTYRKAIESQAIAKVLQPRQRPLFLQGSMPGGAACRKAIDLKPDYGPIELGILKEESSTRQAACRKAMT